LKNRENPIFKKILQNIPDCRARVGRWRRSWPTRRGTASGTAVSSETVSTSTRTKTTRSSWSAHGSTWSTWSTWSSHWSSRSAQGSTWSSRTSHWSSGPTHWSPRSTHRSSGPSWTSHGSSWTHIGRTRSRGRSDNGRVWDSGWGRGARVSGFRANGRDLAETLLEGNEERDEVAISVPVRERREVA
jgi:hypothetical protein